MDRYIGQLNDLSNKFRAPIHIAGDIFDRWNNLPELVNFLIRRIKGWYSIPGQHDLPNHSYKEICRSSYWTLVEAGCLVDLTPGDQTKTNDGLWVWSFPWGFEPYPVHKSVDEGVQVAMVHSYIWMLNDCYPGAPEESRVKSFLPKLKGYDVAVFGDNHKGFLRKSTPNSPAILNCGTFMRRKIDERHYKPSVGLIHRSREVTIYPLDCSEDQFLNVTEIESAADAALNAADFLHELEGIQRAGVDFAQAVKIACDKMGISEAVRKIIAEVLDG